MIQYYRYAFPRWRTRHGIGVGDPRYLDRLRLRALGVPRP
jgi:hypothetical protein